MWLKMVNKKGFEKMKRLKILELFGGIGACSKALEAIFKELIR